MRAAMAMALSPDAQKRLTVDPGTDVGRPDMIATVLPTFWPCGPSGKPAPRMTSSTCAGSTSGTRRSSSRTHCTAVSSGRARLNEPRNDLARPLRTLATIIASTIGVPIGLRGPARPAFPEERGDALARVRMREQARERGGLGPQPVAEQSAARLTQERLDHREHVRRLRRERARDRRRGVEDLGRRDHLLHESPLRGAASVDGLAAEDHEPRAAGSDDAWQPLRAAATRQDADADFGQASTRSARRWIPSPRVSAFGSRSAGNSEMSAPALKPRGPAPRRSATRVAVSVASASSADSSAPTTARLMAFTGGRSIVIIVTPPDRSRWTNSGGR